MIRFERDVLEPGRAHRHRAFDEQGPLSFRAFLDALVDDADLRAALDELVAGEPFEALRWETPVVDQARLDRPFECVTVRDRSLAVPADPSAFREHFDAAREPVRTFPNLGGDAQLVVPCPRDERADYAHLSAFCRSAPDDQRDELWRAVGRAMRARVGARPVWLSTAGGGVPWLHVRLDDRPKYYAWAPYRSARR